MEATIGFRGFGGLGFRDSTLKVGARLSAVLWLTHPDAAGLRVLDLGFRV